MKNGLKINNVTKSFGHTTILKNISLSIKGGEFLVLLGGSGCGKSTLLRMISGLEEDFEGSIHIGENDVTHKDPKNRNVAMVFQSYALYPHMDVYDNIAFGMKIRKTKKDIIDNEVKRVAEVLQLTEHLKARPGQLSGGQRQRVAIGRAMVRKPDLFLFDEPLSNLDAKLRAEMRAEIKRIHQSLQATIAYVTHDQIEAMTLADKIVLLNEGGIEQLGTPEQLYSEPDTLYAAKFIGTPEINTLKVILKNTETGYSATIGHTILTIPASAARHTIQDDTNAILAVRPECLKIGKYDDHVITQGHKVEMCELMGSETYLVLSMSDQIIRMRETGLVKLPSNSEHSISWDLSSAHLFDPVSGQHL